MLQENVIARSKDWSKQVNGSLRFNVEELCGENDFVHDSIHESFVDRLKNLLNCKFLTFLIGNIVKDDIAGSKYKEILLMLFDDFISVH